MNEQHGAGTSKKRLIEGIIRDVCELPDYNSPDDQPDLLQCTVSELEAILLSRLPDETRAGNQPDPYVSGLAQAGIRAERDRRIIERHVRWHDEALRLLQQVNTGYEGEWPEIADFVRRSTARIEQSSSEKASVQLCAPHGKDCLTCPECAHAAGIGGEKS